MTGRNNGGGGSGNGFQALGLSDPVYRGIVRMGFRMPTPVQRKGLPVILTGSDTVVMARTGSGKTVTFIIPILEKLLNDTRTGGTKNGGCRAIVLSPTRELSQQTLKVFNKMAHFVKDEIRGVGINGGEGMEKQFDALASKPDVIVGTPGRLAHHLTEIPDFELRSCQMVVLDEADRLLEMGFAQQIRQIARTLPSESCQKVLLSATMPKILVEFTKSGFATDPQVVRLDQEASVSADLRVAFITCRSSDKDATLLHTLHHIQQHVQSTEKGQHSEDESAASKHSSKQGSTLGLTLIFAATRHHVEYICCLLRASRIECTMIYGTLDQEARKVNLSHFRTGKKKVLVVTDVAARGIDIPLIDHVIHYQFPPSAKLFVHRSGRAARAGRIGYCWALVEPDEMPYMVDLHLFLGRPLMSSSSSSSASADDIETYDLADMTPDMVHYGSVPESVLVREVDNVRRIMDAELSGANEAESIKALTKVCNNAMKQYRKTRPEASGQGVRRAKAILEGEKLESGQRVGGGFIPPHPLLQGMEEKRLMEIKGKGDHALQDVDNLRKREDFLQAMAKFRPKETVFEAFATGGGKETGVVSHVDKGRTTTSAGKRKNDISAALSAMKSMRRQMRMARDKGSSLIVAGSANALSANGDLYDDNDQPMDTAADHGNSSDVESAKGSAGVAPLVQSKRRLSKAERKRLKKGQGSMSSNTNLTQIKKTKEKRGIDFRDEAFYMENDFTSDSAEAARSRQIESAMQPSASSGGKGSAAAALRLEEAMLDVVGDEHSDLAQRQRMQRWDKSKRKYVQTTVGAELSGDSKSKKIRLESGQIVKGDKMRLGQLYEKWQKKTNRSIGRTGVFDDVGDDVGNNVGLANGVETLDEIGGRLAATKKGGGAGDKIKSVSQIRKEREKAQNLKLKNMKKADRKRIEVRQRQQRNAANNATKVKELGLHGKIKKKKAGPSNSGRWSSSIKKGKR